MVAHHDHADDAGTMGADDIAVGVIQKNILGSEPSHGPTITLLMYIISSLPIVVIHFAPIIIGEPLVGPVRARYIFPQGSEQLERR